MNLKEYKNKRETLLNEMQELIDAGQLTDLQAKKQAIEQLDNSFEEARQAQADLNALKDGGVKVPAIVDEASSLDNTFSEAQLNASSEAYRTAFLKHLKGMDDKMTQLENAAFVHTTTDSAAVLPTTMSDAIWNLVKGQHSIMGDITMYRTGTIMEVVKHTAVTQGKGKSVAENAANEDEKNTFVKVTLSGKDFSKTVKISYAMMKMSLEALEQYLIDEISDSLGEAMADDTITTIEAGIHSANKVNSTAQGKVTYEELAQLFGKLKRVGAVTVYASRTTIYNYLVAMVDSTGRPIFQPTAQVGQEGYLLGAAIKQEDSVADNKILVGDPKKVVYNMIEDIMVERDKDTTKHVHTFSGYARGEGALIDDLAFAELTITVGG